MLQLLQDRGRQACQVGIAAQHQHRQTVGMGQRRRGQKVRRPRPRTGRAEHEPLAHPLLGIARRRKPHALFVLPTIEWQHVAMIIQRFAKAGHIAMPKDAKAPTA